MAKNLKIAIKNTTSIKCIKKIPYQIICVSHTCFCLRNRRAYQFINACQNFKNKENKKMFNEILIVLIAGILTEVAKIAIQELVEYIKRKLNRR